MAQVIEDAEKEHDVELADPLGRQIHDVDVDVLDFRTERTPGEFESCLRAPTGPVPGKVVGRDDPGGAAALGFEREEAVPGADVEHAQTGE